jgi:hypothetical protein
VDRLLDDREAIGIEPADLVEEAVEQGILIARTVTGSVERREH